jgi:hypothetical protein
MSTKILAWHIGGDGGVQRLAETWPDFEKHLEDWIEKDPTIVDPDLLIIGRQESTEFGTVIDLLGITESGELIVLELKKDKTLRETVAQSLEYAAWASRLNYEQVVGIAAKRFGSEQKLEEAFRHKFDVDLPDTLNQSQRIYIVAPQITEGTRATIEYLAESFGVPINGISFGMFEIGGNKVLVRDQVLTTEEQNSAVQTKQRPRPTIEQLMQRADANGVSDIATYFLRLRPNFMAPYRNFNGWTFQRKAGTQTLTALAIFPTKENKAGKLVVAINPDNLGKIYGKPAKDISKPMLLSVESFQETAVDINASTGWYYFTIATLNEAKHFVAKLEEVIGGVFQLEPEA